jgi:hypothetical protein
MPSFYRKIVLVCQPLPHILYPNDVVASVTKNLNEANAPNIKKITRKITYAMIASKSRKPK